MNFLYSHNPNGYYTILLSSLFIEGQIQNTLNIMGGKDISALTKQTHENVVIICYMKSCWSSDDGLHSNPPFRKKEQKILKQVEYESARRKRHINEKQEIEMRKAPHFFMYIYLGNSREPEGTRGNPREPKETRGSSRELKRTQGNS